MGSTLNPDEEPLQTVKQTSGATGALGPGDSSDSGSDVAGAKRHDFDVDTELDLRIRRFAVEALTLRSANAMQPTTYIGTCFAGQRNNKGVALCTYITGKRSSAPPHEGAGACQTH